MEDLGFEERPRAGGFLSQFKLSISKRAGRWQHAFAEGCSDARGETPGKEGSGVAPSIPPAAAEGSGAASESGARAKLLLSWMTPLRV